MNRVFPPQVKFLFKPPQSQKTYYVIGQIIESYEEDPRTFFIYICHNVTASLTQTTCRIESAIDKNFRSCVTQPKILKFLSSGESSSQVSFVSNHHEACSTLSQNPEDYIGMFVLAHGTRFKSNHIESIIRTVNNIGYYTKIHIYFDEFDRYSKVIVPTIDKFCSFNKVQLYEFISATAKDSYILKEFGDIPVDNQIDLWDIGSYSPEYYITYEEQMNNKHLFTFDESGNDLIRRSLIHYFELDPNNINKPFYGFIPSYSKKSSHFEMAYFIRSELGTLLKDITVCIINSDFKGIILPSGERYEFDLSNKEILDIIIEAKLKHNINRLIVTGNGCVGRSVTLHGKHSETDDVLIFDFAIYDDKVVTNGDSAYQLDRTKGNIKKFSSKYPITYCTPKFLKWVVRRERYAMIASNDNRVSYLEHARNVDERMKIPPGTEVTTFEDEEDLDTNEKCHAFLRSKGYTPLKRVKPLELDPNTGKYMCSFENSLAVLNYDSHISVFRKFSPVAKYHYNHIEKIKNAVANECIFNRWVLYKGDKPYYFLKVIYKK